MTEILIRARLCWLCRLLLVAIGLFSVGSWAGAAAPSAAAPKLTAAQIQEMQKLLREYRLPKATAEEKDKIVDQLFEIGPIAVQNFAAQIEKQVRPQLEHYRDRFFKQAQALAGGKTKANTQVQEILKLRASVLALQEKSDLSKEEIVKTGDPAIKRLSEILVVDRQAVLDAAADLQKERAKLSEAAKVWERCVAFANDQLPADQRPKEPPSFENYLQGEEELAARLAMPIDQAARVVLAANEKLAIKIDAEEAKGVLACNLTRILLGLNPCAIDPKLCDAGRDHAHDMQTLKFFAHDSPVDGKKTPWDRAKRAGTSASAENIFAGNQSGKTANDAWFHSPGHHKNMLAQHARIGIGRSGAYFTEMFGN